MIYDSTLAERCRWLAAIALAGAFTALPGLLAAETLRVAVASNFLSTARQLAPVFEAQSGHRLQIISGSTGKLYAQITAGAPYDVFLAADEQRPARLEREGFGAPGSRFTYAIGLLVLWSGSADFRQRDCRQALRAVDFRYLAIANPALAPYGVAAREALNHLGIWTLVSDKLVLGENVSQTLQFVASGNASLGLVAKSSLAVPGLPPATCEWPIPSAWHAPIVQQAIVLKRARQHPARAAFVAFLQGEAGRHLIESAGYASVASSAD